MSDDDLPEHVRENRRYWDGRAHEWIAAGESSWRDEEPSWGCFDVPESKVQLLPADMTGLTAIELGCGTGYVSGWMVRRGAHVLFRDTGFEVLDYLELQAPPGSQDRHSTPAAWAERWPAEHVWKLRRR